MKEKEPKVTVHGKSDYLLRLSISDPHKDQRQFTAKEMESAVSDAIEANLKLKVRRAHAFLPERKRA